MKNKTIHWVLLILGILLIIGVAYCYLTYYKEYCAMEIFNDTSDEAKLNQQNFWRDFLYIPGSLLLTGLIFYLAGRYFRSNRKAGSNDAEVLKLQSQLDNCMKKYDELVVQSSGGKIEKKEVKGNNLTSSSSTPSATTSQTESDIDKQIELKKQEMFHSGSSSDASSTPANFDSQAAASIFGKKIKQDDLKLVEGIGPKIESILQSNGIKTWKDLSNAQPNGIVEMLIKVGGAAYKIHDPSTWPEQAKLAFDGKFEELKKMQDHLKGGKEVK